MSTPAKANFTIKANGYFERVWQITNAGVPFDVTGYTFEIEVRNGKGNTSPVIVTLVMGDGITVTDAVNGKLAISIAPQPQITIKSVYHYDLMAIKDGKNKVWLEGTMTFDPGATYI
jgi:hypothetical protein